MHPTLFDLFGLTFHAYSTFVGLGFVVGCAFGIALALRDGRDPMDVLEGATVIVLAAILGSKVFHVLFESEGHLLADGTRASGVVELLAADPWHWARLFEPGYVFYGGVVFAIGFGVLFIRRRGIDRLGAVFDNAAPGLAIGIAFGRTGCFLGGCCYGKPTDSVFAVHFPHTHETAGAGVWPVQLFDVGFGLVSFALVWWVMRRRRFEGEAFAALVTSYALWRFLSELFRGDSDRGLWLWDTLSTSQLVSLTLFPLAAGVWWRELSRARGETEPHPTDPAFASDADVDEGVSAPSPTAPTAEPKTPAEAT